MVLPLAVDECYPMDDTMVRLNQTYTLPYLLLRRLSSPISRYTRIVSKRWSQTPIISSQLGNNLEGGLFLTITSECVSLESDKATTSLSKNPHVQLQKLNYTCQSNRLPPPSHFTLPLLLKTACLVLKSLSLSTPFTGTSQRVRSPLHVSLSSFNTSFTVAEAVKSGIVGAGGSVTIYQLVHFF